MHMRVCMYVYIYIYIPYTCIYIYIYTYIHTEHFHGVLRLRVVSAGLGRLHLDVGAGFSRSTITFRVLGIRVYGSVWLRVGYAMGV